MTRHAMSLLAIALGICACKRPIEPAPPQPALPQTSGLAPTTPTEPTEPEPPALTPQVLTAVQDTMHDVLDRALGVAVTMKSYAHRPDPARVGKMQWVGAQARLLLDNKLFAAITPRDLPCDVINDGDWRHAWTGKGGAATMFDVTPQWWRFSARPHDAFVRVGAVELTAMVFDASRKCWTGATILTADRRRQTDETLGKPIGSLGPGTADAAIFGSSGKTSISTKKISFFDGKHRISFEPTDTASCAWIEWGKAEGFHWVSARFSSGEQADRCPDDVDVMVDELIEYRDQDGQLMRAVRGWRPGAGAPLGRRTTYVRQAKGAAELIYEGTEEHGASDPPGGWDTRCKAVHRDRLSEPVVPVASKQALVGLWSLRLKGKDIASGVGKRTVVEVDCVRAED